MDTSTTLLSDKEIAQYLGDQLEKWSYHSGSLWRKWTTQNWLNAMAFAQKLSDIAEQQQHHPNLTIKYGEVMVEIYSHDVKGITMRDIYLAIEYERIT